MLLDRVILRRPAETVSGRLRSSLHCAWIEVTRSQLSSSIGLLKSSMGLKPPLSTERASRPGRNVRNQITVLKFLSNGTD
jgi:hypothetical protein